VPAAAADPAIVPNPPDAAPIAAPPRVYQKRSHPSFPRLSPILYPLIPPKIAPTMY